MSKEAVFYQVYENLELELLNMTDYIHFSDGNLSVYSVKLSTFILSCNAEVESLLKEIGREYCSVEDSVSIGKCFKAVDSKYSLKEKIVKIKSNRFYFSDKYNNWFRPLHFKKDENNLTGIYNAVKHDWVSNLNKATIEVAINILAVLYLLNVYFGYSQNSELYTERSRWDGRVTFNSQIFDLKTAELAPLLYGVLSSQEPTDKIDEYLKSSSVVCWYDFNSMISEEVHRGLVKSFRHLINYHISSTDQDKILENDSNPELAFYSLKECIGNHLFLSIQKQNYLNEDYTLDKLRGQTEKFMD